MSVQACVCVHVYVCVCAHTPVDLPQDTETDLPVLIEVWIEPDHPSSGGHEPYPRRKERVGWREPDHEVEESSLIGCVKWTGD